MQRIFILECFYSENRYYPIAFTDYDMAIDMLNKLNKPVSHYHILQTTLSLIENNIYFLTVGFGITIDNTKTYGIGTKFYPSEYHAKSNIDWYNEDDYEPGQVVILDNNNICFKDIDGYYKYTVHKIEINRERFETDE